MAAHMNEAQKQKKYINVFYALLVLTGVELAVLFLPFAHLYVSMLVAVFSASKAVVVGYYYMHLEYETRWLKMVVCLPCIAFGYAFFLCVDAHKRPMSIYSNEPVRVHAEHEGEIQDNALMTAGLEADKWLKAGTDAQAAAAASATAKSGAEAEAAVSDRPAGAPPAVEGSDQWK